MAEVNKASIFCQILFASHSYFSDCWCGLASDPSSIDCNQWISVARTCNLIFIVLDVLKPLGDKKIIEGELEGFGIRLNKRPPNITVRKKDKGGIAITNTVPLTNIDQDEIKAILSEYKLSNCDVAIREANATADDLVDVIEGNRLVFSTNLKIPFMTLFSECIFPFCMYWIRYDVSLTLVLISTFFVFLSILDWRNIDRRTRPPLQDTNVCTYLFKGMAQHRWTHRKDVGDTRSRTRIYQTTWFATGLFNTSCIAAREMHCRGLL